MDHQITLHPARRLMRAATTAALACVLVVTQVSALQAPAAKPAPAAPLTAVERKAADLVSAETIRKVVVDLSSPEMEGRGTASPGGERAARYLADRFKSYGLAPAGENGTFFQAVPFRAKRVLPDSSFAAGAERLEYLKDFVVFAPLVSASTDVEAELVLVGYGVSAPELSRDDFAGVDVKGKIAVVLAGRPATVDEALWKQHGGQQAVVRNLVSRGAAGIVYAGMGTAEFPFEKYADFFGRRSVALASKPESPTVMPPAIFASAEGARKLFAGAGADYAALREQATGGAPVSRALGARGSMHVRIEKETVTGSNVAAVIEGSDPALKSEAVMYSAHYDAFGLGPNGTYYPGAADNALGVGEIVAIAEAMAKSGARPRRSVLFLAVTGEEFGLLGAEHWAASPTWPIEKVVANVNYDGIGTEVFGPVREIVGFGAEFSTLGPVLEGVSAAVGTRIIPDPMPEENAFVRSDHFAFVKRGVPALMLLGGPDGGTDKWVARAYQWIQTDYHQTTDTVKPEWNWEGPRTVAVIGLLVGVRVAGADAAPVWNATSPFQRKAKAAA